MHLLNVDSLPTLHAHAHVKQFHHSHEYSATAMAILVVVVLMPLALVAESTPACNRLCMLILLTTYSDSCRVMYKPSSCVIGFHGDRELLSSFQDRVRHNADAHTLLFVCFCWCTKLQNLGIENKIISNYKD